MRNNSRAFLVAVTVAGLLGAVPVSIAATAPTTPRVAEKASVEVVPVRVLTIATYKAQPTDPDGEWPGGQWPGGERPPVQWPPTPPVQWPPLPTESPTLPTQSPTLPTQSPTLPTQSPTLPTQSPTPPTQSPTPPTPPTQSPTPPTQPPTERPTQPPTEPPTQPPITQPPTEPPRPTPPPPEPPLIPDIVYLLGVGGFLLAVGVATLVLRRWLKPSPRPPQVCVQVVGDPRSSINIREVTRAPAVQVRMSVGAPRLNIREVLG